MARAGFRAMVIWVLLGASSWSWAEVLETSFEDGFGPWQPLFSGTWQLDEIEGNRVATLEVPGDERPPVPRPRAYLMLTGHTWTDYSVQLQGRTLMPASSPRRDLVVIFGYVDDTHYYYAHISSTADALHSLIMKVNGSEREVIHLEPSLTPALNGDWQTIRVTHAAAGAIAVFVDDLVSPVMTANDISYPVGAVALGSFNDRAQFDDVIVSGTSLTAEKAAVEIVADEAGGLELNYVTRRGFVYQVYRGETLAAFERFGGEVSGHGGSESLAIDPAGEPSGFYRVFTLFPQLAEP